MIAVLLGCYPVFSQNKLLTYVAPEGVPMNDDFSIKVRIPGGEWETVPSYMTYVDEVIGSTHKPEKTSQAYFDFSGEVEVSVTSNRQTVQTCRVRPLSRNIIPQINGNTVSFKLNNPCNLSVEVNGDIFHNLHLFANPVDEYVPDLNNPDLIYFAPGIHHFENDKFEVPSGKTVYVAGGAVLMGRILVHNAENVKVLGRGMTDHRVKGGIHVYNSRNVLVEGLVTTQCGVTTSNKVTVRNVKSISYYQWGDGMNVYSSNDVLLDGVFCRNSDDCHTVYGARGRNVGGCKNVTMQNATLWADVAHPIFIGIHGNTKDPEILENLSYINIDILDQKEKQIDYQGCMAINGGDNNLIRNVLFENIRVEDFRQGQLLQIRVFYNKKYCTAPGRSIENVTFKNVAYNGENAELSLIAGYNEERVVKNIHFEDLKINGLLIYDDMPERPHWFKTSDMARIFVGEHVEDIRFTRSIDSK